jgi:hypothetical protein
MSRGGEERTKATGGLSTMWHCELDARTGQGCKPLRPANLR